MADETPPVPPPAGPPPAEDVKQVAAALTLARAAWPHVKRLGPMILTLATFAWKQHQAAEAFRLDVVSRVKVLEAEREADARLSDERWQSTREQLARIQDVLARISSSMGDETPHLASVPTLDRPAISGTSMVEAEAGPAGAAP